MDNAVILAEGVFGTTYGKTANGLVRYSKRFAIRSVIDSALAGSDAGTIISGKPAGIPVISTLSEAMETGADTLIVGTATDGGNLPPGYRPYIAEALRSGMSVVSGLHEFISDDHEFSRIARKTGSRITDVRKMFRDRHDVFTGRILDVKSTKIAVLGTDSAVGKRTTAININVALNSAGKRSTMVGTGQTSWMQGFEHTIVLDAIVSDFVPGALETVTWEAWNDGAPDFLILEGQGSVIHPAYPGSYEIIGACRPDAIILQHAPAREFYDGFEGFRIPPLENYIKILELMSGKKVIAISLNTEKMTDVEIEDFASTASERYGIPVFNPLSDLKAIPSYIQETVTQ